LAPPPPYAGAPGYGSSPGYGYGAPPGYGTPPPSGYGNPGAMPVYPSAPMPPAPLSSGLSGTLQGFFWAGAAMSVIAGVLALVAAQKAQAFDDDRSVATGMEWTDAADNLDAATGFSWLIYIVVFVLILIWGFKAHRATQALHIGRRKWGQGWTIGAWFIPLASMVIPKLVFNETERIADAPRTSYGVADTARGSTSAVGWVWWLAWVVGLICMSVGSGLADETSISSLSTIRSGYLMQGIGFLTIGVAGACGALFVRRLSRRLSQAGLRQVP
jgi:hypothetical protein